MNDQLDRLFADLRSETMAEVRPPGTAAARHTVRRRKIATSAAAGTAVLAVVAGVAVGLPRDGADRTADRASGPIGQPISQEILAEWGKSAAEAVGLDWYEPSLGAVVKDTGQGAMLSTQSVLGGTYVTKLACLGLGAVSITVEATSTGHPAVITQAVVPCTGAVSSVQVAVAGSDGTVTVQVDPDAEAAGRASVAYQMELSQQDGSHLQDQAQSALATAPKGKFVSSGSGVLDGGYRSRDEAMTPGRYRAQLTCVGAGTVVLTVELLTDEDTGRTMPISRTELKCGPAVSGTSKVFTVPRTPAGAIDIVVTPDERARGQVAAAFQIERV